MHSEHQWLKYLSYLRCLIPTFQVSLVGQPLTQILRDISSEGAFIGQGLLLWPVPLSSMGLLVLPKMLLVRRMQRSADARNTESPRHHSAAAEISRENIELVTAREDGQAATPSDSNATAALSNGPRIQIVTFD